MKLKHIGMTLAVATIAVLQLTAQTALANPPPAIEEAYELTAADLTLPTNEFGSVILQPCPTCDRVTLRVDGETRYVFSGVALPLNEFRSAVLNLSERSATSATVIYGLEDRKVRRVEVVTPAVRTGNANNARG